MCIKKDIIELLRNPMISSYSIEKMSNGRISTTTASKYRNRVKQEIDPFLIFTNMSYRTIKNFEELAKEIGRAHV